jgi:D-alanyl-D-alanine carboxypeptidase (penicillin-binding protein 5/6)
MRFNNFILASLLVGATALPGYAAPAVATPDISARSALVVDGQGKILYERNANKRLPNASTTKILTALVVIDNAALEDVVTVSHSAQKAPPSRLGFGVGERFTVLELLYALLLESANDAAVALAEHVAGSQERFAALLNRKAKALGAQNTHFVTPSGLHMPNHDSTARDLAIIMRAAMQSPIFVAIAQTQTVDLVWPGNHAAHRIDNHNKLLASYGTPVLGKTGFTNPAGRCYVGATQDSMLTVVMLGSHNLWRDARRLFDWGIKAQQHTDLGPVQATGG